MLQVSPALRQKIQQRIDALVADALGAWPVRVCRDELNALPLHADLVYLWALRPDGEVLCMDHEAFGHPTEPERNPATLRGVLAHGARLYPELAELVPPSDGITEPSEPVEPPPSPEAPAKPVPPSDAPAEPTPPTDDPEKPPQPLAAPSERVVLPNVPPQPVPQSDPSAKPPDPSDAPAEPTPAAPVSVDNWLERIDRGDQLAIKRDREWLFAGRIAGHYVCRRDEAHWAAPATAESRRELENRLWGWLSGQPHEARWLANPTASPDPWESAGVTFFFEGRGSMGGFEAEFERLPDGTVRLIETMLNDWDPAGWMPATSTKRVLSAAEARDAFVLEMSRADSFSPFPQIRPRHPAA